MTASTASAARLRRTRGGRCGAPPPVPKFPTTSRDANPGGLQALAAIHDHQLGFFHAAGCEVVEDGAPQAALLSPPRPLHRQHDLLPVAANAEGAIRSEIAVARSSSTDLDDECRR